MFVGGGDAQEVCVKCRGPSGDLLFSQRGLNSISREADPDPFTSCCLSEVIFFDLLSVSGSDVTDPTGIVKIQWRLKTHMRFWNKYDGLLNQVVKAWRIGRSSEKKKSSGNGTQIWNIMRTGDGPEKTGLWSSLYGMLVTHAGISVQQTEPALKLWAVFPLVSLPHGSSSIRPPSTTEELFSLQEEDGEPGNLTSLLFLLRAPSVRAECETSDEAQLLRTSVYI
ncbi:uncharacterized protein isoform X3 [Danio rerio]|uniref:Uncharacterized protein isoform X3 n=3 Tax=Danio rerio TaxID=7955 RepID=A0AC58GGH0_DANRE